MGNKYLEKIAEELDKQGSSLFMRGLVGAQRAARVAGSAVKNYASEIPADVARLKTNLKNIKTIHNVSGTKGVASMLVKNKAVQTGAGLLGAGAVAGAVMNKKKRDDQ